MIGYRVYRQGAGGARGGVRLRHRADVRGPKPSGEDGPVLDYWVVAIDQDPDGARREGAPPITST